MAKTSKKSTRSVVVVRPALIALRVGQSLTFPITKLKSIRTQASELGAILGRQYSTKMDREDGTVSVWRVS